MLELEIELYVASATPAALTRMCTGMRGGERWLCRCRESRR
ncbi:hypothetical protein HanIR_Chr13g0633701 [Helianthus annuus]|nr:hypothetical protein HanIR_Chr13g0633701 [Helianthus annuus]